MAISTPKTLTSTLRENLRGEVFNSPLRIAQYSSDASNYRVPPAAVVYPRDAADLQTLVQVCGDQGVSLTMRGGGTSVAGNSVGEGVVADTSVHMNRIVEVDSGNGVARVQPGVVLRDLQRAAAMFGLALGPDPSTQGRATIGGMVGNNACGPHSVTTGKMSDNVVALDVIDGNGRRFVAGDDVSAVSGLRELVSRNFALIRSEFGRFGRQVSGYSLEHLLPEHGHNVAKALVGTEGTVAVLTEATVALVEQAPSRAVVVLGYPSMVAAADDVPALIQYEPLAMEGLDARLVDVVRRARGSAAVPDLPAGAGWLMVETGGDTAELALAAAADLVGAAAAQDSRVLSAGPEAARLWRLRSDGAGLGSRTAGGNQAWPGWEDAAVPPAALGSYLRDFEALMERYGLEGLIYGHFGDGCLHVRLDLPLERDGSVLRAFAGDAADLVASYGGSLSGEHGDGRARSEMLGRMYSPEALKLMSQFKGLFDPLNRLNPGVVVDPEPMDVNLRRPGSTAIGARHGFAFTEDGGDFTAAVHRCVGVGKCRANNSDAGEFMCPSYRVTKDETHVTRGRARVLQELTAGSFGELSWDAPAVAEALDLCLSCKACASDCPVGVDMAKYKAETLFRRYRGRRRPASHYALGWLPRWARASRIAPRLVNAMLGRRWFAGPLLRVGGIDGRRTVPRFAEEPFRGRSSRHRTRLRSTPPATVAARQVLLWVDSFTGAFRPETAEAAILVLEDAGYEVLLPAGELCCGLTWISTGQLDVARRKLKRLVESLSTFASAGVPIVGLEPSCTAVLRSDLLDLLPEDPAARAVAASTRTVAEILAEAATRTGNAWEVPDLSDVVAVVQPHCHQHAVMGSSADIELLERAGARVTRLSGCCGLAGNFGMERGHYETSVAVAELELLPALKAAPREAVFLADGFSCRTQAEQLGGIVGVTLPELLSGRLEAR